MSPMPTTVGSPAAAGPPTGLPASGARSAAGFEAKQEEARGEEKGEEAEEESREVDHVTLQASEGAPEAPQIPTSVNVRQILEEQARASSSCGPKQCGLVFLVAAILGTMAYVLNTQQERLQQLSVTIADLGFPGRLVFFGLFLWVGLPCGYNYSTVLILVGFSYGWLGLIDSNVGSALASLLGYRCGGCCLAGWTRRCQGGLSGRKQLYLEASRMVIESDKAGFLMQVALRLQPVLPFGLMNTFLGAYCQISCVRYLFATLLGLQPSIIMMTAIGVLVRDVGSLAVATASPQGRANLIVNVTVIVAIALGTIAYVRYLTVHVLPRMVAADAVVSTASPPTAQPHECEDERA